jgi:hypothetical protein
MREFNVSCRKYMQLFFSDIDAPWQEVLYFAKRLDSLLRQPKLTTRIGWPECELDIKNT